MTLTESRPVVIDGVGDSPPRPDGVPKVDGSFVFSSDEILEGTLWGVTLRSPHPRAASSGSTRRPPKGSTASSPS